MLVTIRNLPANTRYADLKSLIVTKCGLTEMILDNLTPDGNNTKKVTVGLAEEEDAAILMRKINGLLIEGHQVFVEAIKKKQGPAYGMNETSVQRQPLLQQPYYQQSNYQPSNYQQVYTDFQQNGAPSASYTEMYGVATTQNAFANYGYPQQMQYQSNQMMAQPVATFDDDAPLGFSNQGNNINVWANQNDWNPAGSASGGNSSQQSRNNSRWDNSDDNIGRPRRDAPGRERERDRGYDGSSRNFGRDASSRDVGRKAPPRDFGRDAQSRGFGRDGPSRDRGRDAPRDQRRDAPQRERGSARGRDAPSRNAPTRNAPGRDAHYSKSEFDRGPSKRPFSANNAPSKPSFSPMNKFSHQRDKPGQNRNTMQPKASPNVTRKAQGDYIPAVKRQRPNADQYDKQRSANNAQSLQSSNPNPQSQTISKKKPKKNDPETLLNRASTWRSQIASAVARDMVKNPEFKNDLDGPLFVTQLKRAIRHRLDMLFGENIYILQKDMVTLYREKYSVDSDADFFKEVTEDIKIHGAYNADDINKAAPDVKKVGAGTVKKAPTNLQGAVAKEEDVETVKKIPSYPQGDKRLNKEFKKANVMIFQDTDALVSRLKPDMQKALDEEVEEMAALIAEEFQDEPEPQYENFHKRVKTTVTEEYKQMLKVNVAKRLLKIRPIMVRIFNTPKIINRSKLAPILAEYGIDSLRKSEKKPIMYFGTCETYEQHDKLCTMEPLVVDGSKIWIRPFQLIGFNEKITKEQIKMHRKNMSQTYTYAPGDYSSEIEEQNEEVHEDIGNENVDDQYQAQSENDHEDQETEEKNKEQEGGEATEIVESGKEVEQQTCENDYPEEAERVDPDAEGNYGEQDTELDKENSTEVDSTGAVAIKSKENEQADTELNEESQNEDNSFITDGMPLESNNAGPDKNISINLEDSEDDVPKNYEDIDIDDINDDDLEDW